MVNEDKGKFSNLKNYDEELEMLEEWLINPRIDKNDYLVFDCSIDKYQIEGQNIELFFNLVDSSRESRGQQPFQEKKMQVYQ